MEVAENYLKFCIQYVLEKNMDDLVFLETADVKTESSKIKKKKDSIELPPLIEYLKGVVSSPFARVTYTEGIELLLEVIILLRLVKGRKIDLIIKLNGEWTYLLNMRDT